MSKHKIINDFGININKLISSFCDKYQIIYNYQTIKPSVNLALAQNLMVQDFISFGIWNKWDFLYIFQNHTNNNREAQFNWINPGTFDSNIVYFSDYLKGRGFRLNGYLSRIVTNYNPLKQGINYQLNSSSLGCYILTPSSKISNILIGNYSGKNYLAPRYSNIQFRGTLNSDYNYTNISIINSNCLCAIVRPDAFNIIRYINENGISENINSLAIPDGDLSISMTSYYDNSEISMVFGGGALTNYDMLQIKNIFNTYSNYVLNNIAIPILYKSDILTITADNSLITADKL